MNVRSAILSMLALASFSPLGPAAPAAAAEPEGEPAVTIALIPHGTGLDELAEAVPGVAPGLLSAGLGEVGAGQSYLDMGQGGRLAQSLYPKAVPPIYVTGDRVPERIWRQVRARAAKAPAEIVPGLLASTMKAAGVQVAAAPLTGSAAIVAADRSGRIDRITGCRPPSCPGVTVTAVGLEELAGLAAKVEPGGEDLLIAIERPPTERELLSIGVLGGGFEAGNLTSATTRMDGYVLATDLLPTILARYGVEVPADGVSGREIETTGAGADPSAVADRGERLGVVRERRPTVLGANLLAWIALAAAAVAFWRRRGARIALPMLAIVMALVPAFLLLTASLAPSAAVERLIVGAGAPIAAALILAAARRFRGDRAAYAAFAFAAAVSVAATALDIVFGSPLTALSLIGPNPALGVRFFGIGNELEATIAVLLTLGAGAAVTASGATPPDPARRMAIVVVAVTVAAVLVFAPGRLGADVGAAITFPAGAAGALIVALRLSRGKALLALAAPVAAVALLLIIDLVTGGDAHLSRSVLGAGGLSDLGDVMQRRVEQSVRSFPRYLASPFFIAAIAAIVAGILLRHRIGALLADRPAALAGIAGAITATTVGTLANDSGALLLMVGTGFIAAFCGLAWAVSPPASHRAPQ